MLILDCILRPCFLTCQNHLTPYNDNILFDKFYHNFDISGNPLQLFWICLSNRKQFVKVENVQSGLVDILNGVTVGLFCDRFYLSNCQSAFRVM